MAKARIKGRAARVADRTKSTVDARAADARTDDARPQVTRPQPKGIVSKTNGAAERAVSHPREHLRGASAADTRSIEQQPGVAIVLAGFVGVMLGFLLARH